VITTNILSNTFYSWWLYRVAGKKWALLFTYE